MKSKLLHDSPLAKMYWVAKGVGWDNVPRRLWQAYLLKSGSLRRRLDPNALDWRFFPNASVAAEMRVSQWKLRKQKFFPIPSASELHDLVPAELWGDSVTAVCEAALAGDYRFFSKWYGELGWPPNFNRDPVNLIDWPVGEHWLRTARSGPPRDDIKLVWEASRWSLAFDLARQYIYSGDDRWAESMWTFIEAWLRQNPVNQTVAWGCGQEVALRLMALLVGVFAVSESPTTTPERLAQVELLCWQSAKRIEANLNYARSQENNHALSEAVGLWTVGLLFPEFPEARRWTELGRRVLEGETRRQIYDDGSYVQHSMSYHRVMLDDLCWAIQLGRRQGMEFSERTLGKLAAATLWLREFVDATHGRVPNYGSNDGANILPLACADYLDYRPTLQLAAEVSGESSGLSLGPWSEKTLWLCGKLPAADSPLPATPFWQAKQGGYFILRGPHSYLMTRATTYRDRPGQCDMLHVDLWYRGINLLRDAGSFHYYHREREIKNYFYSATAHNTVQVEGADQMTKGPSFLWFHWPTAHGQFLSPTELHCQAKFCSFPPYVHERQLRRIGDCYTVVDQVSGADRYTVRWRLAPELDWKQIDATTIQAALPDGEEFQIEFTSEFPDELNVALEEAWESLYYGERSLCPAIKVTSVRGRLETGLLVRGDCASERLS